jgi:hypothetical protein
LALTTRAPVALPNPGGAVSAPERQIAAGMDAELAHRAVKVALDRADRKPEVRRDLRIRQAAGGERRDLVFALGQRSDA